MSYHRARAASLPCRARCLVIVAAFTTPFAAAAQTPSQHPSAAPNDPAIERRVESLLARLSADEKIRLLGGVDFFYVPGSPRLGVPRLGWPTARSASATTARRPRIPAGIGLAATWNPALAERVGERDRARRARAGACTTRWPRASTSTARR